MRAPPNPTPIVHITHVENLGQIIAAGGIWSTVELAERGGPAVNIGHGHIKDRRSEAPVRIAPGGTMAEYVPFYFNPKSPMLYAIMKGKVEGYQGGQEPVICLQTDAQRIAESGSPFVFTDRHAVLPYAHQSSDLRELDRLDWDVLRAQFWHDTDDHPNRCERRQAEFLVHRFVPWNCIITIGVMTAKTQKLVESELIFADGEPPVRVMPGWYHRER